MKKVLLLATLSLSAIIFAGCSSQSTTPPETENYGTSAVDNSGNPDTQNTGTSAVDTSVTQPTDKLTVVAAPKTISIKNFAFSPVSLTVKKGTTIVWKNDDTVPHNIVFDTFSSDKLQTGDTYSHKFSDVGDYSYKCGIHPTMTGTIVVIN